MSSTSSRDDAERAELGLYDPDRVPGLVARWIFTTPHLSRSAIYTRSQLRTLPDLTVPAMHAWIAAPKQDGTKPSNNYVRDRTAALRYFLLWLIDEEILPAGFEPKIDWTHFRREYPRVYGKRQSQNQARFLTYDEAYVGLLGACQDGSWIGSRDQLAIRLGLLGLRRREIVDLTWADWDGTVICKTGKRNRIREVRPGPKLADMLTRWRRQYERALGRPLRPADPLLCGSTRGLFGTDGKPSTDINWGRPLGYTAYWDLLQHRSRLAGLGHVAPHDLRRTAANILHNAKTTDGGHLYDLLDIQKVLDHASPRDHPAQLPGPPRHHRQDPSRYRPGLRADPTQPRDRPPRGLLH